ncbi:4-hydroxyphenylacetate catabolism regulatory protein HpaA [Parahaliea mediterranea]|uniref:4-hydroxyphenylacetate catabolism regulatory protein HpaA n=1 Tax=Parahaliea mediterranea TaxID=651086 RepID=UPI000E2EB2B1|nr:4-hydroxyphenylacetate catabolism regulatory protein HpaA [Parahaliea mediterranea]
MATAAHPSPEWIPNINLGEDYDQRYTDAIIHYDALDNLAGFFGRDMPVHRHAQFLQIHYIEQGAVRFHIDDKLYETCGPALFLTPPATPHSFCTEANAGGHVLTVHQSMVWRLLREGQQRQANLPLDQGVCLTAPTAGHTGLALWRHLQTVLQQLGEEWQNSHPGKAMALEYLVGLLLLQIARLSRQCAHSTAVPGDDLKHFHRFSKQVELHFRQHWRLSHYAQAMGLSESRLNQVCQRVSNSTPKKIVHERLLQEAKRMLIFGTHSINGIAYELGFSDPGYLSRFFKSQVGLSPLAYRRLQQRSSTR